MSTGVNRFFIGMFYCDGFASRKRVLAEVRREKRWQENIALGYVPEKPRKMRLRGREMAAYFMIVQAERNPMIFLAGIPVAVLLYAVGVAQVIMRFYR